MRGVLRRPPLAPWFWKVGVVLVFFHLWSCFTFGTNMWSWFHRTGKHRAAVYLRPTATGKWLKRYARLIYLPLLFRACFPTYRLFPKFSMPPNVMDNTLFCFPTSPHPWRSWLRRPQQASDGSGSENKSDKFDSGGRYVDSFAGGLDSMAAGANRVKVKSNWRRVWALGNVPGRGGGER
jgi:hypothetical protein